MPPGEGCPGGLVNRRVAKVAIFYWFIASRQSKVAPAARCWAEIDDYHRIIKDVLAVLDSLVAGIA